MHLLTPGQLNTYDVLDSECVVFTEEALAEFLDGPIGTPKGDAPASEQVSFTKSAPATAAADGRRTRTSTRTGRTATRRWPTGRSPRASR